jgi:hypothetical protein
MDNRERSASSEWISASVELLAPPADWEPDLRLARVRFDLRADARLRRRSGRKRILLAGAAAALAVGVAVPAIPQTHAVAQQAAITVWQHLEQTWYWWTIVRRGPGLARRLADAVRALHTQEVGSAAVIADAGFTPRLPDAGTLAGAPELTATGPRTFTAALSAAELTEAVRAAGWPNALLPAEWDGAHLTLRFGPVVTAHWTNVSDGQVTWSDLTLVQGRVEVTAPLGFDRTAFAAAVLRAAGMRNPDTVRQLAVQSTTLPALLSGFRSPYQHIGIEDVPLRSGFLTMIEEFRGGEGEALVERLTLLWSAASRTYVLSAVPRRPLHMFGREMGSAAASAIAIAYATAPPTDSGTAHHLPPVLYPVRPDNR